MEIGRAAVIALLMTAVVEGGDVTIEKGIRYLPPGRAETLDLYLPPRGPQEHGKRPGIVIIHGGGRTGGDKGASEINIGTTFASHGYVCVSINYALAAGPTDVAGQPQRLQAGRPLAPQECREVRNRSRPHRGHWWVGRRAPDGHARGDWAGGRVRAGGGPTPLQPSAGGGPDVPGAAAGLNHDHVMFPGKQTEMPEVYRAASPINHVTRDDAPMLILHGTADTTTPLSGSQRFADKLEEVGVEHQLVIVEGAPQLRPAALATRFEGARHRVLRQAPEGRKAGRGGVGSFLRGTNYN